MNYIFENMKDYTTGLSLFYPLLYSIVVGMEAKSVFEFGAGYSTKVILDALKETDGYLYSISTDTQKEVMFKSEMIYTMKTSPGAHMYSPWTENWTHVQGQSQDIHWPMLQDYSGPFDVVLHDSSHTEEVVYNDLKFILEYMKYNSVLLVHDVLHSNCGKGMRNAVEKALKPYEYEITTLPYGFGLSIIVLKDNRHNGVVEIKRHKPTSKFVTAVV